MLSLFHLTWKKLDFLHLKDLLNFECKAYLKESILSPQRKIIGAYRSSDYSLAIETGLLWTIPIPSRLCHLWSCNVAENETQLELVRSHCNSIRERGSFPYLYTNMNIRLILVFVSQSHWAPSHSRFSMLDLAMMYLWCLISLAFQLPWLEN